MKKYLPAVQRPCKSQCDDYHTAEDRDAKKINFFHSPKMKVQLLVMIITLQKTGTLKRNVITAPK